jgi:hypothetical protein
MEWTVLHQGLQEKGEILFYQGTLFIGESERHVKEGSVNGQLISIGALSGNLEGGSFTGQYQRQ